MVSNIVHQSRFDLVELHQGIFRQDGPLADLGFLGPLSLVLVAHLTTHHGKLSLLSGHHGRGIATGSSQNVYRLIGV